jgi:lysozyme
MPPSSQSSLSARAAGFAGVPAAILALAAAATQYAAPRTMAAEGVPNDGHGNAVAWVDQLGRGQPPTICFGQTGLVRAPGGKLVQVKLGLKFPISHCSVLLEETALPNAIGIWRATPTISAWPRCWGEMIDFTHNFNVDVYASSSIAREFNQGHWAAGADALLLYNKGTVNGKKTVLPGLVKRRANERADCLAEFNHQPAPKPL